MPRRICLAVSVYILLLVGYPSIAQETSAGVRDLLDTDKLLSNMYNDAWSFEEKLQRTSEKYLNRIFKRQERLKRKLLKSNRSMAESAFGKLDEQSKALRNLLSDTLNVSRLQHLYSSRLDSCKTSLEFLNHNNIFKNSASANLKKVYDEYHVLQIKLSASNHVGRILNERQLFLREQLNRLSLSKELKKLQKDIYYYRSQLEEYKEAWENPSKIEAKLFRVLSELPAFQTFFNKHSQLAGLIRLSGAESDFVEAIGGLQSRDQLISHLQQRLPAAGSVQQQISAQLKGASDKLEAIKNKIANHGSNADMEMPDFKPNQQKTKSFLQRLEFGSDLQSTRGRYSFPIMTDIALSVGYKLNNKSIMGLGLSYKLGWGEDIRNIKMTHEGFGVRSFLDWKLKGNFFLSGGVEMNYRTQFSRIAQLKELNDWQQSGLAGISKRYRINKKLKGSMRLMWDMLSYQQVPKTEPLIFRVGYNF